MFDWDELRRSKSNNKSKDSQDKNVMKIATKKVAVRPEDLIKLPDGTVIVREKNRN